MRSERTPRTRRYWVAVLCIVTGALIGAWHNYRMDRGRSDLVVDVVRWVVAPPANLLGKASRWVGGQTGWIFHGHHVAEENTDLKRRLEALEQENAALREAKIDNDRLRTDLNFKASQHTPPLGADVIARRPDPNFDTLVISRGSNDGVHFNSVVVTRAGVVGHVYDLTPNTASVLMLIDQNSGVGARVQRANSRATGVCKGDNSSLLSMIYLPADAGIKAGDTVVTSGLGGIYPPGLVIGTVTEVKVDEANIQKIARVRPRVEFDRLEEVYVLP